MDGFKELAELVKIIMWPLLLAMVGWVWRTDRRQQANTTAIGQNSTAIAELKKSLEDTQESMKAGFLAAQKSLSESHEKTAAAVQACSNAIAALATQVGVLESQRRAAEKGESDQWNQLNDMAKDAASTREMVAEIRGTIGRVINRRDGQPGAPGVNETERNLGSSR